MMGYEPPDTLTPSKIDRFTHCPLAFRLSYLDKIPEPSSLAQVRGTLVHKALELLFQLNAAPDRTAARAQGALESAWEMVGITHEARSLELDEAGARQLLQQAGTLLDKYLSMEDPTRVEPLGLELDLRSDIDGVAVRGIIDRLDLLEDGALVVVDYKTGRAPRVEQSQSRLAGVQFYAYLCEQVYGRRPHEVRLLYLGDQVVVASTPSEQSMRALRQKVLALWTAIVRACDSSDFRPRPSALCSSCSYKSFCPAFGGDPNNATRHPGIAPQTSSQGSRHAGIVSETLGMNCEDATLWDNQALKVSCEFPTKETSIAIDAMTPVEHS